MTTATARTACPRRDGPLVFAEGHAPWRGQCEWQLDAYENRPTYDWREDNKWGG